MNRFACRIAAVVGMVGGLGLALAAVQRDSLPNGLVVLTYETARLPMVDLALVCRSGSEFDPEDKAGLANLTASMLVNGSRAMSPDSVEAITQAMGTQFSGSADFDQSELSLRVLTEDMEQGLSLLADAGRYPRFDSARFEMTRDEVRSGASQSLDMATVRVDCEFRRILFPHHPYGQPTDGDVVSLAGLRREDLIRFHTAHYVPNNCFLVAVGDLRREDFLNRVRALFGDWQSGPVPTLTITDPEFPSRMKVKLITRPDLDQTTIQLGHPGIARSNPDWLATDIGTYILGGGASSRLAERVREKAGLAYWVQASFDGCKYPGAFQAWLQTSRPKEAIALLTEVIRATRDSGVTQAELASTQNFITGNFPISLASNQGRLDRVIEIENYRLGLDWIDRYPALVRELPLREVNRSLRAHLNPGHYVLVVMGNVTRDELGLTDVEWVEQ
jgi:zinc protease